MFSISLKALVAAVLAVVTAVPSFAADQPDDTYFGQKCGMNSFHDPSGQIHQGRNTRTAEIGGGPFFVVGASEVQMVCWLSIGDAVIDLNDPAISGSSPGSMTVALGTIDYTVEPGVPVYVCTGVYWMYPTTEQGGAAKFVEPCLRES